MVQRPRGGGRGDGTNSTRALAPKAPAGAIEPGSSEWLGIAQLAPDLSCEEVATLDLAELDVWRSDRRRLWKRVTDLELTPSVAIHGVFAEEAEELLDLLG